MARSDARHDFLIDVLICAIEDGCINGWRTIDDWDYDAGTAVIREVGDGLPDEESTHPVDLDVLAKGIGRINRGEVGLCTEYREGIAKADRENDAGWLDALSADAVLQAGLFNDLVYG